MTAVYWYIPLGSGCNVSIFHCQIIPSKSENMLTVAKSPTWIPMDSLKKQTNMKTVHVESNLYHIHVCGIFYWICMQLQPTCIYYYKLWLPVKCYIVLFKSVYRSIHSSPIKFSLYRSASPRMQFSQTSCTSIWLFTLTWKVISYYLYTGWPSTGDKTGSHSILGCPRQLVYSSNICQLQHLLLQMVAKILVPRSKPLEPITLFLITP